DAADLGQRSSRGVGVPLRANPRGPLALTKLAGRVDPLQLDLLDLLLDEMVDAHDHALARLDLARVAEGRVLDLALHPAGFDRGDGAAEVVDPLDQLARALLQVGGERFDEPRSAERVGGIRGA